MRASLQKASNLLVANVLALVVLLLLLEVFAFAAFRIKSILSPGDLSSRPPRYQQKAHEDHQDWIWQHLADKSGFKFEYRLGLWEPPDYRSQTLNASSGRRMTSGELTRSSSAEQVWVFGGSTIWGIGVSDEYTIPSFLNRISDDPDRVFVNYGTPAYQTTQEILKLTMLLARGEAPGIVVMYDGANEITTALEAGPGYEMGYEQRAAQVTQTTRGRLFALYSETSLARLVNAAARRVRGARARADTAYEVTDEDRALVQRTVDLYRNNIRYVRRLGNEFDFEVLAFFQPYLGSGYEIEAGVVTNFERGLYEKLTGRERALIRLFYDNVRGRGEVIDLSRALVEAGATGSYFDVIHFGPAGNEILARRILDHLP